MDIEIHVRSIFTFLNQKPEYSSKCYIKETLRGQLVNSVNFYNNKFIVQLYKESFEE